MPELYERNPRKQNRRVKILVYERIRYLYIYPVQPDTNTINSFGCS